jgi:hypothetical protein
MGKSFKRRWNKARIQKLKALRNPTDEFVNAGTSAVETVKEIIHTLSEPEIAHDQPHEAPVVVEEAAPEPTIVADAPKKRRKRRSKTTTVTE